MALSKPLSIVATPHHSGLTSVRLHLMSVSVCVPVVVSVCPFMYVCLRVVIVGEHGALGFGLSVVVRPHHTATLARGEAEKANHFPTPSHLTMRVSCSQKGWKEHCEVTHCGGSRSRIGECFTREPSGKTLLLLPLPRVAIGELLCARSTLRNHQVRVTEETLLLVGPEHLLDW